MPRLHPTPMSGLVDVPVRYDLAESTCPPVPLRDLLTPEDIGRLEGLELGYGTTAGDLDLRTLIAAEAGVEPGDVLITVGGISALFLVALALCEPGDSMVLATPCFPPAGTVPEALNLRITSVPLSFQDGYRLDLQAISAALTPSTRLVSLASPQNPSGIRFTEEELLQLVDRIDEAGSDAVVLVDEAYRQSVYGHQQVPRSAASLARRVVTCSSLSKSHGAPGLRIGWLTATQPELYERLRIAKFNTLAGCSGPDELLAAEVLRQGPRLLASRRELLATALDVLVAWAQDRSELVELLHPDDGALCCLRLRGERFDEPAVRRFYTELEERDTRVAPGSWFFESDHVFRVGFGHLPPDVFAEALDRLGDALTCAATSAEQSVRSHA